jgi:alpha-L-fucosidase
MDDGRILCRLPRYDSHAKRVASYVEPEPDTDYRQAPEEARETFRDMKYGVRIHWGMYSAWKLEGESWPFLEMLDERRAEYNELYRRFDPAGFDADAWMSLFARVGLKVFAFTTKHHEGFSMFDTRTRVRRRIDWTAPGGPAIEACDLAYSVMESPYGRDVVRELCDAARRHGIRIDLYFSHPDWYDADFRPYNYHPMQTPDAPELLPPGESDEVMGVAGRRHALGPPTTPEETERMLARHRAQLTELLTGYGPIDLMCLDQWMGPRVWPHMRETMKLLRRLQPRTMFRCRGIGNYGDYYTPEGFVPGRRENTDMPWMVIYPLGGSFSYDDDATRYKGGRWIVRQLVDAVAKGGNFMVGIGPDTDGRFHPKAVQDLEDAGRWLAVNGEAIFATRPREGDRYREGRSVRFTRSKDGRTVYAIVTRRLDGVLVLKTVRPAEGSEIRMLGGDGGPLPWTWSEESGLVVRTVRDGRCGSGDPERYARAFRIQVAEGG